MVGEIGSGIDLGEARRSSGPMPPFRWDVRKREQLGRLLAGWQPTVTDDFLTQLLVCSARVTAFCSDGDLHFVGRSPDSIFDLLSGVFAGTSWEARLRPLPISLRWQPTPSERTGARYALRTYLSSLELTPQQISGRPRPAVLVDIVDTGGTYGELIETWLHWAEELGVPWAQVRGKLRLVGMTARKKTSPKTWRWQQHAPWADRLPSRTIKNVSVPHRFWSELASRPKASRTFPPGAWANPSIARPSRHPDNLTGLREAVYCYEAGRIPQTRERFAGLLMCSPGERSSWVRTLAHELRARPGDAPVFRAVPDDTPPAVLDARRRDEKKQRRARRTFSSRAT